MLFLVFRFFVRPDLIGLPRCNKCNKYQYEYGYKYYSYEGRDLINRSQTSGASARRGVRVYKKFLHEEFSNILNCVLGYVTSCVASIACAK